MEFFNKKQEVLEVKLTPYGRYKLSKGVFKPAYYAFFDEGIIYNSAFTGGDNTSTQVTVTEGQNSIEPRIQDDTPSTKTLNVFTGIQTAQSASAAIIRAIFKEDRTLLDDPLFMDPGAIYNRQELQYVQDRIDFFTKPLGRSRLNSNKQPAWAVTARHGEISSSLSFYTSSAGIEKIPQIDIAIKYRTYAAAIEDWSPALADSPEYTDEALTQQHNVHNIQAITTTIKPDGTYVVISPEDLIIQITEKNVDFNKENFDIEVYLSSSTLFGNLLPLKFNDDSAAIHTNTEVPYYLTLEVDNEISNDLLRQANIEDFSALGTAPGSSVISTREYFIRDLYAPEEDICE